MKGNVVAAAGLFGLLMVLASAVLVFGIGRVADRTMNRFELAVREHARGVERAGAEAGMPIAGAVKELGGQVNGHAEATRELAGMMKVHAASVERSGEMISRPILRMEPVEVRQPVTIQGPREGGALPVEARIGK